MGFSLFIPSLRFLYQQETCNNINDNLTVLLLLVSKLCVWLQLSMVLQWISPTKFSGIASDGHG